MKTLIIALIILLFLTSCQKSDYKCVCTNYGYFTSANTTNEFIIHDTKRKAKKRCDANNPKPNGGYIGASRHCELK